MLTRDTVRDFEKDGDFLAWFPTENEGEIFTLLKFFLLWNVPKSNFLGKFIYAPIHFCNFLGDYVLDLKVYKEIAEQHYGKYLFGCVVDDDIKQM